MSTVGQFMTPIKLKRQKFIAAASQTIFNLTTISIPNSDVQRVLITVGGLEQPEDAYTVNTPTQIQLSEACEGGESVNITTPSY